MPNSETLLRTLAVLAAVAILAAPYWRLVADALKTGAEAAKANATTLGRVAAAGLIVAAAWGKIPMPSFEVPAVPAVTVEEPSAEMKTIVAPVGAALQAMPMGDRMLWAATWNKAAIVVAGDGTAREAAFTDTRSLQAFTALALDIAWRRIGQHEPGSNEPLRKTLEAAYADAVGRDEVPVTRDIRDRYAAFAKAVAWAGVNGG
jgi:hypothetical protein